MAEYVAIWFNPNDGRAEWEMFDSRAEADAALAEWKIAYPWNEYVLAKVILTQEATAKRPTEVRYSSGGGGGANPPPSPGKSGGTGSLT